MGDEERAPSGRGLNSLRLRVVGESHLCHYPGLQRNKMILRVKSGHFFKLFTDKKKYHINLKTKNLTDDIFRLQVGGSTGGGTCNGKSSRIGFVASEGYVDPCVDESSCDAKITTTYN